MKTKFEVDWGSGSKNIKFTRVVHSIHFKKFNGSHLVFSRWPNVNSVSLDNMKTNFKLEVDWGNSYKHILPLTVHIFQKFYGGHLDFSRWPKINRVYPLGNMTL